MGTLEAICLSEKKGTQKKAIASARLLENYGLEKDAHAGPWHRQISLLASEDIDAMKTKGLADLQPGAFGENLVTCGIDLDALGLGSRLRIGDNAELAVTQRGKTCHNRCAIYYTAGDCIMPKRGIFARVLREGAIRVGDSLELLECIDPNQFQAVVLTISDKGARGEREDTAGPAVATLLEKEMQANIYATEILPDKQESLEKRFRHYAAGHGIDLILAVGGTGFAPTDVTPEAVRNVLERFTPGLDEAMRAASLAITPRAMLSRAVSGILKQTLIISLPGSERAAMENLQAILTALPHGLKKLRGDTEDCATPLPSGEQKP